MREDSALRTFKQDMRNSQAKCLYTTSLFFLFKILITMINYISIIY